MPSSSLRQPGPSRLKFRRGRYAVGRRSVEVANRVTVGPADSDDSYEDELPAKQKRPGSIVVKWATTTDHKTIGTMYLVTSFAFFVIGGVLALFMRAELARPGTQIMSNEQFNQAFTMHGTIMLLMFATPLFAGFANWIMPLQIGAP
ncbi:cbb3-type cytochrome c oxidase subunit I, partial [Streptomyces sp. NPDC057486]|uniref:cbb3-type cytochrome c oxidase subunit I n=1 Tax=Streptomyces sp. NPDC057486 TaxID=3346145 RepID=UPI0036808EFD